MRYLVLATDYDGTLAHEGHVEDSVVEALLRCRASGRRLVMVTGRELADLKQHFSRLDVFDYVVVENGAALYHPATNTEKALAERPPEEFIRVLQQRDVFPISVGHVIVATWTPHEKVVLETIRDFGLELQVIFNKGAVMILPSGVNKATGLAAALTAMGISPHNVVSIGDAENDHALLGSSEAGVAVANSIPTLLERADMVTQGERGAGVIELIDRLVRDDLADLAPRLTRHHILVGRTDSGQEISLKPYGTNVLIAGTSGSGKSSLATALLERMVKQQFQLCVIDPEGDHEQFAEATVEGSSKEAPDIHKVIRLLEDPRHSVVVNLHAVSLDDRPTFFAALLTRLQELRSRSGHPQWIVVDEAHHVLPSDREPTTLSLPRDLDRLLFITLEEADLVAAAALASVDTLIALGDELETTFRRFSRSTGVRLSHAPVKELESGQAVFWSRETETPVVIKVEPGQTQRRRHSRKYAEGDLGAERSFYFRGPDNKLNLRAQNLILFLQLAEGVDDETWQHHLRRHEYSQWFRDSIKDQSLAEAMEAVESNEGLDPADARTAIRSLIEKHYTLPGNAAQPILPAESAAAAPP